MLVSCWAYSLNLTMEVTCSSETSIDFQRIKRRYIPADNCSQCKSNNKFNFNDKERKVIAMSAAKDTPVTAPLGNNVSSGETSYTKIQQASNVLLFASNIRG
jgi:hypothetical protein